MEPTTKHPRRLTAMLAAFIAVVLLAAPAARADDDVEKVRVATYNIHHGADPDENLSLDRIAREIRRTRAEVIGLQEVDRHWSERSDFADQAAELAKRLRMEVVYGANLDLAPGLPGQPRRQYGTAILTKHEIESSRNTPLPRPRNGEQRGLLEAVIEIDDADLRFATTHLQHNSQEERTAQVLKIRELLDGSREPVALVGDLNALPTAPELAPLYARYDDAWLEGGRGPGFTFSSENPDRRIDYIFASREVTVKRAEVLSTLASDHLPVLAELRVPKHDDD